MRLIIDTDAGTDDAQAIMLALTHPNVTIEAITTVTGNVHVDWVIRNVSAILHAMEATVPLYRGADRPLLPSAWEPLGLMGPDGFGNYQSRPASDHPVEAEHAANALIRLANAAPGEYTLIGLGPMTNIALACRLDPTFPQKIKHFAFMGGTITGHGNTPNIAAEYNIFCDPEAALIALDAFADKTMVSWETTLIHGFSWEAYDALAVRPTPAARLMHETSALLVDQLRNTLHAPQFLLPDPLAMAVTLAPDLILASEQHYVTVEIQGTHTRGQTVVDYAHATDCPPNTQIVTEIDTAGVYQLFEHMLA